MYKNRKTILFTIITLSIISLSLSCIKNYKFDTPKIAKAENITVKKL